MQNKYVGDFGDFVKYSLIKSLSKNKSLGIAWYLFPDETKKNDGNHTKYLEKPDDWRNKDPQIFDIMRRLVEDKQRNIASVVDSDALNITTSVDECLHFEGVGNEKRQWRCEWFSRVRNALATCDLVFADPDTGLCLDKNFKHWRSIPLSEVHALAEGGRTVIIYHHNTRRPGGHAEEIRYWMGQLKGCSFAVRCRAYSPRTFFVLNASRDQENEASVWSRRFGEKFEFIRASNPP